MSTTQIQKIREFVESMPATRHLGIRIAELEDGRAVFEMLNDPTVTFDGEVVQGGIVGTLADYAAVAACGTKLPDGWLMATTTCETHNLAPANGARLIAVAEVVKPGRRHAVARADVYNDERSGQPVLTGLFCASGIPPREV